MPLMMTRPGGGRVEAPRRRAAARRVNAWKRRRRGRGRRQ